MSVKTIDTKTALIVIDLQKGIVNLPSIHPISGIIKRSCALIDAFRQQCGLPVVARQRDRWCARSSREVMRSCFPRLGETGTTQEIIDLVAKRSSNK